MVIIFKDVKYWYGVMKDSWFVYLVILINVELGGMIWLEFVFNEYYNNL